MNDYDESKQSSHDVFHGLSLCLSCTYLLGSSLFPQKVTTKITTKSFSGQMMSGDFSLNMGCVLLCQAMYDGFLRYLPVGEKGNGSASSSYLT